MLQCAVALPHAQLSDDIAGFARSGRVTTVRPSFHRCWTSPAHESSDKCCLCHSGNCQLQGCVQQCQVPGELGWGYPDQWVATYLAAAVWRLRLLDLRSNTICVRTHQRQQPGWYAHTIPAVQTHLRHCNVVLPLGCACERATRL